MKKIEKIFKEIVQNIAKSSTCIRVKVGALLVKENRIIATSWNGVASGQEHCEELFKEEYLEYQKALANTDENIILGFKRLHHDFAIDNELHAEQNIIAWSARHAIGTEGTILYITESPCKQCAKLILAAGIKEVRYINPYDTEDGRPFLEKNKIQCIQI